MRVGEMPTRLAVKDTEQTAHGGMNTDMAAQEDPTPKTQVFADIVRHLQMASTTGVDTHADITMGLRKNDVVQACHPPASIKLIQVSICSHIFTYTCANNAARA